jgi:hypothetical protein
MVYVASSWKNQYQPGVVDKLLRGGHDVYDFRHPSPGDDGFHWSDIDVNWRMWSTRDFVDGINKPTATAGFLKDMWALHESEAVVLLLPCGRSAHAEADWAAGAGRKVFVFIPPPERPEPELMYRMFNGVTDDIEELLEWLAPLSHIDAGEIDDSKTIIGVLMASRWLRA